MLSARRTRFHCPTSSSPLRWPLETFPALEIECQCPIVTRALTVTFLIPAFGMLWGAVFLGETITLTMSAGCGLVLLGTALTLWRPAGERMPQSSTLGERSVR
jgi:hypothetical protein